MDSISGFRALRMPKGRLHLSTFRAFFWDFWFVSLGPWHFHCKGSMDLAFKPDTGNQGSDEGDPLCVETWYCGSGPRWPAHRPCPKVIFRRIRDNPRLFPPAPIPWTPCSESEIVWYKGKIGNSFEHGHGKPSLGYIHNGSNGGP